MSAQAADPALLAQAALRTARQVREGLAPAVAELQRRAAGGTAPAGADAALLAEVVGALYALEAQQGEPERFARSLRETLEKLRRLLVALQEHGVADDPVTEQVASSLARLFPVVTSFEAAFPERPRTDRPPSEPAIPLSRPRRRPAPPPSRPPQAGPADEAEPVVLLERRAVERVDLEVGIGFHSESNFYTGFSGDISEGGLFVATYDLLPVGTEVNLSFWLPEGTEVSARGRVAWVREARGEEPPGMGIRFLRLSEEARAAIGRFVQKREPLFHDE